MGTNKREVLLDTATRLFTERGFKATGIAEILGAAGCAKGTLYQHFESKEALIEAVLRRMGEHYRTHFVEAVERAADTPAERLVAVFRVQEQLSWSKAGFCGCPFTRVAGEFGDRNHPLHRVAALSKRLMAGYLKDLATQAGAADPEGLATQLALLMEGASVLHAVSDQGDVTERATAAARTLVQSAVAIAA
jgi:AcrR family transcriptional regulator